MATASDYRSAIATLFRECFEGIPAGQNYTWFVQGKEGVFDAIENTTAAQASVKPSPTGNTLGAHVNHIRYTLWLCNAYVREENPESDWEGSWAQQAFTEEEWAALAGDLKKEYADVLRHLESDYDPRDNGVLMGTVALLPHMAYHLGAVRQLRHVVV